jgi:hypothetical protein
LKLRSNPGPDGHRVVRAVVASVKRSSKVFIERQVAAQVGGIACMGKSPSQKREDEVLLRMLKTPPKPHADVKAKDKANSKASKAGD